MNKLTYAIAAVLGAALLVGGYYLYVNNAQVSPETAPEAQGKRAAYEWQFIEQGEDASGMPRTAVRFKVEGNFLDVGTYSGSCREVAAGEPTLTGEAAETGVVTRAQCWFAGAGDEIYVFENGPRVTVRVVEVSEGSAEEPASRGEMRTVLEI